MYVIRVRGIADGFNNVFLVPCLDPANENRRLTADPGFAVGDLKLQFDADGTLANSTNLPEFSGEMIRMTLTQSEMQRRNISMQAADASNRASPAFGETAGVCDTISHALALHHGAAGA